MIIFLNFEIPKIIKIRRRIWKIFETFFHVIERVWFYFMYYPKFAMKQEIAVKRAVALSLIQIGENCTKSHNVFRFPSNAWFYSIDFHETHHCLEKPHVKCSFRMLCKLRNKCGIYCYDNTCTLQ